MHRPLSVAINTAFILLSTSLPASSNGAIVCDDSPAPTIEAAASAGLKCQKTIAKEAQKFVKARLAAETACIQTSGPIPCPDGTTNTTIQEAVATAQAKIAAACASNEAQGGLSDAYGTPMFEGAASTIASCVLGQHNARVTILLGNNVGLATPLSVSKNRDTCSKTIAKSGNKVAVDTAKTIAKCLDTQAKLGTAGDLAPICIGGWVSSVFTAPSDLKTAEALAKISDKAEDAVVKSCTAAVTDGVVDEIFACSGATNIADLEACVVCPNFNGAVEMIGQEYAEAAVTLIEPGDSLQAALDAASVGDKLLIASGTYNEATLVGTAGLSIVGCGGASGDRPVFRPADGSTDVDGMRAVGIDGLTFQSLEFAGWDENGIFSQNSDNVVYRDIVGTGENNSVYAIYPVQSSNVLVEGCTSEGVVDAGIYVGQDEDIVVRYNRAWDNVAGIEVENSARASVYNNLAYDNTGGLLVFKLPGPALQISLDHDVFHNVLNNNNTANFCEAGAVCAIPQGTGLMVISTDTTDFHHNVVQGNNSFGIAILDQRIINAVAGPTFVPESVDQTTSGNTFRDNLVTGNGLDTDTSATAGLAADIIYLLGQLAPNCIQNNVLGSVGGIGLPSSICP